MANICEPVGGQQPVYFINHKKTTYENSILPHCVNAGSRRQASTAISNGVIDHAFLFNNDVKDTALEDLEKGGSPKLNDAVIAYSRARMKSRSRTRLFAIGTTRNRPYGYQQIVATMMGRPDLRLQQLWKRGLHQCGKGSVGL